MWRTVAAVMVVLGSVAACGGDDGGSAEPAVSGPGVQAGTETPGPVSTETEAPTTGAPTTTPPPATDPPVPSTESAEMATHSEPLDDPDCADAVELASVDAGGPEPLVVSETSTGQWFCVDGQPLGLDSSPEWVDAPAVTDAGSLPRQGLSYLFVLPADTPLGVVVQDESGTPVPVAQSLDGDHLLLLDIDVDAQATPDAWVDRTWTVTTADGTELMTLQAEGPAAGSAPASFDDVVDCLEDQGVSATDAQPYPVDVAVAAWTPCAPIDTAAMVASGMPADDVKRAEAFLACMAAQGWIQVLVDFDTVDVAAHNAASTVCSPV